MASCKKVADKKVLRAMAAIPREIFVPPDKIDRAYIDSPILIKYNQTISQPYIIARMIELLNPKKSDIILEVGAGSGYMAAILSLLANEVISIERNKSLAKSAKKNLRKAGVKNVKVVYADGAFGYKKTAPYQGIIVSASASKIPGPLLDQLEIKGRLVIPLGLPAMQYLTLVKKNKHNLRELVHESVRFVPLLKGKVDITASPF